MSTTGTTTPRSAAVAPMALLRHRTVRRLLPLAVAGAVLAPLAHVLWGSGGWPGALSVSLDEPLRSAGDWIVDNRDSHWLFLYFFGWISAGLIAAVHAVYVVLLALGWAGVTAGAALVAWRAAGVRAAVTALASFAACGLLDMWVPTMRTLALMVVAVAASVLVGALLGLAAGLSERAFRVLRPVLDTMQALPAFAYLLPVVLVFGIGVAPAVLATVVYAAPPMARLTALGLRSTDPGVLEAVDSLGATPRQRLLTARLPMARKQLLLGVNQAIMMALSMAVIASVIGADGLGDRVYQALSTVDVGAALAAGIPIVLLAIVLDRTTSGRSRPLWAVVPQGGTGGHSGTTARTRTATTWALGLAAVAALALTVPTTWPKSWTLQIARPVNQAKDWLVDHLYTGIPGIGGTADWAAHYTGWILDPLRDTLQGIPWWGALLLVAALARAIGTWRTTATATAALAAIGVMGRWDGAMDTLSQVLAAVAATLVLGFAVAVATARSPRTERLLRPVLDVFQTMPQFVYLIPVVALFGVGRAPAAAAAVVYALPAVVRIAGEGLRQVSPAAMESSRSLGATGRQQLFQVQFPLARPALLLAVNQAVVLVLSVVIIGALVGGGGLGYDVVFGLARGDLAVGLVAGASIACLGLMLDRVTQPTKGAHDAR
ncbi:ABC transporter permease [Streptomyces luteireticuli]|uniref:ABC transporter permease n=1 Tax=Streptomyces luteireticuli TaxID=173858 RepID=UPI00355689DD